MMMKPTIPILAAGFHAPTFLDVILSTAPIALEGTRIIKENVLSKLGSKDQRLEKYMRAVFRIIAWNDNSPTYATGSAFLISADGLIITNLHVIAGRSHFAVNIPNADTGGIEQLSANPELVDPEHDLALLSLNQIGRVFPDPLQKAQNTYNLGEDVVSIGFPAIVDEALGKLGGKPLCTFGKINGLDDFIIHGARIAPGNSGCPLISQKSGKVIGVNTGTCQDEHGAVYYLAVPVRYITDLLDGKCGMSYAEYREYLARYAKDNS